MNEQDATDLLATWLNDPTVLEIFVDGFRRFYFDKGGKLVEADSPFRDDDHLLFYLTRLAASLGQQLDTNHPMVDLRLKDGSRATVVIPPISTTGPVLVIRKFLKQNVTFNELLSFDTISGEMVSFLKASVNSRLNILVAGGTGAGKTTILNTIANATPADERVIVIQEVEELNVGGKRLVALVAKPASLESGAITVRDLVWQALKMRPERLVLSEIRGNEIVPFLEALKTGHDGSMANIHATSPREALGRLETILGVAEPSLPLLSVREQLAQAFDLIVQCSKLPDGTRRISAISEVSGLVGDNIGLEDIFVYRETGQDEQGNITGRFEATDYKPRFSRRLGHRPFRW